MRRTTFLLCLTGMGVLACAIREGAPRGDTLIHNRLHVERMDRAAGRSRSLVLPDLRIEFRQFAGEEGVEHVESYEYLVWQDLNGDLEPQDSEWLWQRRFDGPEVPAGFQGEEVGLIDRVSPIFYRSTARFSNGGLARSKGSLAGSIDWSEE